MVQTGHKLSQLSYVNYTLNIEYNFIRGIHIATMAATRFVRLNYLNISNQYEMQVIME